MWAGASIEFLDELNDKEKDLLLGDIQKIDFEALDKVDISIEESDLSTKDIMPPAIIQIPVTPSQIEDEKEAFEAGCSCLESSKGAVFTAAGGQSSRLGLDFPKGAYPVTPVMKKSLFQVHAEKIAYMQKRFQVKVPWIIMVSETNSEQTVEFFESHSFFGLDKNYIRFAEQGIFPALDKSGKIFLKEKYRVFLSPSGHGGTFSALKDSRALLWLKELGIQEIFYFQVDNILAKILDPVFIGYHIRENCAMSSKCVRRKSPNEKVGVFVVENGRTAVIEYSEISKISSLGSQGAESFMAGNIAMHIINVGFAENQTSGGLKLPFHIANKIVPYINEKGERVVPEKPNGLKIETFIFDALRDAEKAIIMEAKREEEFSPLKNKSGDDSPQTVLRDQILFFSSWFRDAGISVPLLSDGTPRYKVEISPLYAFFKEDFLDKIDRRIKIDRDIYIE